MKILLLFFMASLSVPAVFAQANALPAFHGNGTPVRVMSSEEANQLNGVAHPTINGIPYDQYKAEQEALKLKPVVQNTTGVQFKQSIAVEDPAIKKMSEVHPVMVSATPQSTTVPVKTVEHPSPIKLNPAGLGVVTSKE